MSSIFSPSDHVCFFHLPYIPLKIAAVVEEKDQLEAELAKLNAQIAARQVEVEAAPSRAANAKKGGNW